MQLLWLLFRSAQVRGHHLFTRTQGTMEPGVLNAETTGVPSRL